MIEILVGAVVIWLSVVMLFWMINARGITWHLHSWYLRTKAEYKLSKECSTYDEFISRRGR